MPTPNDKELYEKVKKGIYNKYPTHSAYRSGLLVQKYKEEYYKKHKNNNAYNGNREQSNLKRWFNEKWRNDKGEVGYKTKSDIYRPTVRINSKTPTTIQELTKSQIERAKREKQTKGRVKKFNS
jgi:hypothetical protein